MCILIRWSQIEDKTTLNPLFGFFMLIKLRQKLATLGSKQQFLVDWLYFWRGQVENYKKRISSQSQALISLSNNLFSRNGASMSRVTFDGAESYYIFAIQRLLQHLCNILHQYSLNHFSSGLTRCTYEPIPFQIQLQDLHHEIMNDLKMNMGFVPSVSGIILCNLMLREVFAHNHTACKWQCQNLNTGCLIPEAMLLNTIFSYQASRIALKII